MRWRVAPWAAFPGLLLASQAALAGGPNWADGIRACAGMLEPADRLSCYDRLAGDLADERVVAPPAPRQADPPPAVPAAPAPFGRAPRVQPEPIESRLQALDRTLRGQHRFTLENQQVWVEVTPGRGGFRAGAPVRIDPTTMGSFVLVDEDGRSTRVRRVQ